MANLSVTYRETGASPAPFGCMNTSWLSGNNISSRDINSEEQQDVKVAEPLIQSGLETHGY